MDKEIKSLDVKNMVCNRCIKVIKEELEKNDFKIESIELGKISFRESISEEDIKHIEIVLNREGFELLEDRESKIINQIKTLIIDHVHYGREKPYNQNFSDYLSSSIGMDYSNISKLFSLIEGRTIENYIIEQKIERTKELLIYNELSISEISYDLEYSSPQHLSRQFKQVTGMTPTEFKKIGSRKKLDTI